MRQTVGGSTIDGGGELRLGNHVTLGHLKLPSLKNDRREILDRHGHAGVSQFAVEIGIGESLL
jgi:hypothetical protein